MQFSARFNGVSREIAVPIYAVQSIFARENGRGVFFDPETAPGHPATTAAATSPALQSVPVRIAAKIGGDALIAKADDDQGPPDKPKAPPRGKLRVIK